MRSPQNHGEVIIFQTRKGLPQVNVQFEDGTVWLSAQQIADLFRVSATDVEDLILCIYQDGELTQEETCRVWREGDRETPDEITQYNLDMILSLSFRMHSAAATRFRQWASGRLREYLLKGFTLDDDRLKGNGGENYWKELLDRIRDIRSSDKVLYRQVLDLYATSIDYDPESEETEQFFRIVRDKLHFAAHGHTAADVIYQRADAGQQYMGLASFSGEIPVLRDVNDANNYLNAEERKRLGLLVSGYFDLAEAAALKHQPMTMRDHISQLDRLLAANGDKVLDGNGNATIEEALEKAHQEYRKYQAETVSPVERAYIKSIASLDKAAKDKGGN